MNRSLYNWLLYPLRRYAWRAFFRFLRETGLLR